jgi:Uncharacterised nucleotidyltransferase
VERVAAITLVRVALQGSEKIARLVANGTRLRIDAGTRELLDSFELAGVHALLLKGPSIARWLYADGAPRPYLDCDLLVGPTEIATAEHTLRSLGYACLLDGWGMPRWWCEHAAVWRRHGDGLCVDLHRTLVGVRVDDAAAWRVLAAGAEEVVVAGRPAPTLGLPARAMYVALHAAQHGPDTHAVADLDRALAVGDDGLWLAAAALAARLEAAAAFLAGLRLTPAGARLVTRLALPDERSVEAELRVGSPPALALGFEQLARARGTRARAQIVWRKLAPSPGFLRASDPRAADGRLGLAHAYLRRGLWLARHAPRGLEAWYRAHRSVRQGGR